MIDRKALGLDVVGQIPSTKQVGRVINVPGTFSFPIVRSGIPVIEQIQDTGVVNRIAAGINILANTGTIQVAVSFFLVDPTGANQFIFVSPLQGSGSFEILFDPNLQLPVAPPMATAFDEFVVFPIQFEQIFLEGLTDGGTGSLIYQVWLSAC